jgi:Tol biopolymer transport system component/predicted Ser/Thr protein kinase
MSDDSNNNDEQIKGGDIPPTASFGGSFIRSGSQIGQFRIERELGRGGMGVVYLAHDTRLDRPVAIKSLPPQVMGDDTFRSRLEREAKLLASLNHPNIATIYEELEEARDIGYLVLEYVAGETLAERLTRGRLEPEEALLLGLQITEAVSAAHSKGVIHRDLKPSNIKIDPEGAVKVLDFGVAKMIGTEVSDLESTITLPGRIIGTPAYMSPEQARGIAIDHRSDIWSFGCVLYEMLTGVPAFKSQTSSDTLAGVLKAEPDWQKLPDETPNNIRVLLRRCLEKDPRRRLHDIADATIEINETLNIPAVAPPTTSTLLMGEPAKDKKRLMVVVAVCLLLGIIAGSVAIIGLWRSAGQQARPARRFVVYPKTSFEFEALWHCALALSPDGSRLAYVEEGADGRRKIYLRELSEFEARPLPGTEGAISPFFSPDGEWIGYVDHFQRKLKKVSIKGGEPVILADSVHFRGGSWGSDDTIVFSPAAGTSSGGLWRISASGEGLEELTVTNPNNGGTAHIWPQILPDGQSVLFTSIRASGSENQFELYSLKTGRRRSILKGGTYARYVPTGHIVYADNNMLYAIPFDIERLQITGSAVPIITGVMTPASRSAQCTISGDGTLAYIPAVTRSTELKPVWVDRQGQVEVLPAATPRNYGDARVSPDGRWVAFGIRDGDNTDVWIYDLTRHTLNPLTSGGNSGLPIWTPDGQSIMFGSFRTGKPQIFGQPVPGSGKPELIVTFENPPGVPVACSPDGAEVLVAWSDPKHPMWDDDIYVVRLDKQSDMANPRAFIQRNHNQRHGIWSPDGRWVAYASDESGRWEIYVEQYPGPGVKIMVSTEGGFQPVWSQDGKELFYRCGDKMIATGIETKPEFRIIRSEVLFEGKYLSRVSRRDYDVAPDGRFLMIRESEASTPLGINVVLNWLGELK